MHPLITWKRSHNVSFGPFIELLQVFYAITLGEPYESGSRSPHLAVVLELLLCLPIPVLASSGVGLLSYILFALLLARGQPWAKSVSLTFFGAIQVMLISHRYNFIFIHVYKVAGTSMESVLKKYTLPSYESGTTKDWQKAGRLAWDKKYRRHIKAKEVLSDLGEKTFERFFKFAFVRNPWDWQVSLYEYMLQNKGHPQHDLIKNMANFEEYIEWRVSKEMVVQKRFISDNRGNIIVDFVGRYENLQADFQKICAKLGIASEALPHLNRSDRRDYRQYYNERTKNLILEYAREDIEMFCYDFDGN